MKITVDPGRCEAHGICMSIDPEVFELGDDDVLVVLDESPAEEKRSMMAEAVSRCPRQALSLQD